MNFWETLFIQPLVNGLLVFNGVFGNLGVAIIALTAFIRIILLPVTLPSMRAMQKMKDLSPEIAKLKQKHKDDKARLMQAQADLYKSKGVNPAAGCLPQIVQLIILFALVGVFNLFATGNPIENVNKFAYPALRLTDGLNTQFLYLDLTKPDVFRIPEIPLPIPGILLITAALTQLLSSKMLMPAVEVEEKKTKKTKEKTDDMMASMQKQMLYLFPLMTIFIGFQFASGLVLYWLVLSGFQMIQQYAISGWGGLVSWRNGLASWLNKLNMVKSN